MTKLGYTLTQLDEKVILKRNKFDTEMKGKRKLKFG